MRAIQSALAAMKPKRKIGVIAAPGDRRDVDIQELAVVAANTFDRVIVREDYSLRGRDPGEIAALITETIQRTRPSLPVSVIVDEHEAVREALSIARPGDTLVLLIDSVDDVIEQVKQAGKTAQMEESEALWCPVPEVPSSNGQRPKAMVTEGAIHDGEPDGHS
jgi:cyanophycin synthetase